MTELLQGLSKTKTCKGKVYQRARKPRCRDKFNKFSCGSCGYGYRTFKKYVGDYLSASVKGEQFLAKVQIFVYAPADENGNGLSEITCEIMQGLKKADTEKIISELSVSAIDFDTDINAIFRKVEFTMEFFVCEEV